MNYYEILGLSCEGKEADDVNIIDRALIQWEKAKISARNNESNQAKRKAIEDELKELPNMQKLTTDAALRKKHAEELKTIRLGQLNPIADVLLQCGTKEMAKARVTVLSKQIGLLPATVEKHFKGKGLNVVAIPPVNLNSFITSDMYIRQINEQLTLIHNHMKSNPDDPCAALEKAENMYQYLAVLQGDTLAQEMDYTSKTADQLNAICQDLANKHVSNSAPFSFYKKLESLARSQLFQDTAAKQKYDNALKLTQLSDLFQMLDQVPATIKLERSFAEQCLKKIRSVFKDEDQAIAIYNRYGNLPADNPYEKESLQVITVCGSCGAENVHDTLAQAQKANCSGCGHPLFRLCPSCKKPVSTGADYCSCGFFIKGAQSFGLHFSRFQAAIKNMNLDEAQKALTYAEASDPSENRLASMKSELQKMQVVLGEPIKKIEGLIAGGQIFAAQTAMKTLQAQRPGVNLKQYQDSVNRELQWANAEFEKCKRASSEGQALEICMAITKRVADYAPAQEWQRLHKPKPVLSVAATTDNKACTATLQWKDNPDNRYVTYTVVRKENVYPQNEKDGTEVASGLKEQVFRDTTLKPGVIYGYAVFAVRGAAASTPVNCSQGVLILQELKDVHVNVSQKGCALSWEDIPGSKGVRVCRADAGSTSFVTLAPCARTTFNDTSIKNRGSYRYALQTVWEAGGKLSYSSPLYRDVQIQEKPPRVDLVVNHVGEDGNCLVSWKPDKEGALRLIALNRGVQVVPDQVYGEAQMKGMGRVLTAAVSMAEGRFAWYEETGVRYRVAAFRMYGDNAVAGQAVEISTVPALVIDEEKTAIVADNLRIVLEKVPGGVQKIFYLVSSRGDKVTEEAARRSGVPGMDAGTYRQMGVISVDKVAQSQLTVSLIAMYGSGADAYFSPVTTYTISNLPKVEVKYRIAWPTVMFGRKQVRRGARLIVTAAGERIPEMSLCCRNDGKMIFNYQPGMPGITEIFHVPSCDAAPGHAVEFELDERRMSDLPKGADVQLFLATKEKNHFEAPVCDDPSTRKMPAP